MKSVHLFIIFISVGDEVTEETATVLVDAPSGPVIVDAPPLPIVVDILTATPQPRKRSLDPTDVIGVSS